MWFKPSQRGALNRTRARANTNRSSKKTSPRTLLGARRKKVFIAKIILYVTTVFALVFALWWGARLEQITIQSVDIEGNEIVSEKSLRIVAERAITGTYVFLIPKANSLFYPKTKIESLALALSPRIKGVKVSRDTFRGLTLSIEERSPYALWCGKEFVLSASSTPACKYLDSSGFVFADAPTLSETAFLRYYGELIGGNGIGARYMSSVEFEGLYVLFESFTEEGFVPIYLERISNEDYRIGLQNGGSIIFDRNGDLSRTLDSLASVLSSEEFQKDAEGQMLEYLDLRFGDKAFYKFR